MVAEKDFAKPKHEHVEEASNLQIIMLCKSLESRGHVRSTFNWCEPRARPRGTDRERAGVCARARARAPSARRAVCARVCVRACMRVWRGAAV